MYGTFSWTKYSFSGDATRLSPEQCESLRQLSTAELEAFLAEVRSRRWAEFRVQHRLFIRISVAAAACVPLMLFSPVFAVGPYLGGLFAISLAISAISRARSLTAEEMFLRAAYARAQSSATFHQFTGRPASGNRAYVAERVWSHIRSRIRKDRPLLMTWVDSACAFDFSDDEFIVYFPPSERPAMEALQTARNFPSLQSALAAYAPLRLRLSIISDTTV